MDFERMMSELFSHEDSARATASRLMQLAHTNRAVAAGERHGLLAFLRGPLERHMTHEERDIFPLLRERGLDAEVDVALKQHAAIRAEADRLARVTEVGECAEAVYLAARIMLHHTNFEGDYIYPELSKDAWHALMRESIEPKPPK